MKRSLQIAVFLLAFIISTVALGFVMDNNKTKKAGASGTEVKVEILGEKYPAQDIEISSRGTSKEKQREVSSFTQVNEIVKDEAEDDDDYDDDRDEVDEDEDDDKDDEDKKSKANKKGGKKTKGKAKELKVNVKGKKVKFDEPPVLKGGRVLIPVRAVTQSLGATVDYDATTDKVTITKGETTVIMTLGSRQILVNGVPYELDVSAQALNNRTFVPLRFLAEVFGEKVDFDAKKGLVSIGEKKQDTQKPGKDKKEEKEEKIKTKVRVHFLGPVFPNIVP